MTGETEIRAGADPPSARMPMWAIVMWLGIAVSAMALLTNAIVFGQGFGALFWFVAVPTAVAAVLAWRATLGVRWALFLLIPVAVAVVLLAGFAVAFVVALSRGQEPGLGPVESLAWALPLFGGLAILIGSLWGLRAQRRSRVRSSG